MLIGNNVFWYDSLDSTQDKVIEFLKQGVINSGDIVISWEQSKGRGQRNHQWFSEPGKNLTLSFPLFLDHNYSLSLFSLTALVSISLHNFLQELLPENPVFIKWVNDLIYQDHKIGGILIDTLLQKSKLIQAIIGIGINVNQADFPVSILHASSLKLASHKNYELVSLLDRLLEYLNLYAERFFHGNKEQLELYNLYNKFLYRRHEWIAGEKILGVNENGLLITTDVQKQIRSYSFPEPKFNFYK